jgi:hypothetical protein
MFLNSGSVLSLKVEDELVACIGESKHLVCCRVETFGDDLLVAAVDHDTGVISALDDLTSQVISQ